MITSDSCNKLFPGQGSLVVFLSYMMMFVAQGMLVTTSRHGSSSYSYNTVTVVLLTEVAKLIISGVIYLKDSSLKSLVQSVSSYRWVLGLYLVPASLYCLYNNLSFVSLQYFNPTTYFMFMQIRLLLTGVIYQILFRRSLSRKQWLSLLILTAGCMIHASGSGTELSSDPSKSDTNKSDQDIVKLGMGCLFILVQVLCSVVAGVYNEYLIKGEGADIHIMIQNVFMYLDSIFCNAILLGAKGDLLSAFSASSLSSLNNPLVVILIANNAVLGIVTSLFLKKLNSILKAFASALELVITAVVSVPILGIPLTPTTVLALGLISVAVVMYAQNPVQSQKTGSQNNSSEEKV